MNAEAIHGRRKGTSHGDHGRRKKMSRDDGRRKRTGAAVMTPEKVGQAVVVATTASPKKLVAISEMEDANVAITVVTLMKRRQYPQNGSVQGVRRWYGASKTSASRVIHASHQVTLPPHSVGILQIGSAHPVPR